MARPLVRKLFYNADQVETSAGSSPKAPEGLAYAYEESTATPAEEDVVQTDETEDLASMMARLKGAFGQT